MQAQGLSATDSPQHLAAALNGIHRTASLGGSGGLGSTIGLAGTAGIGSSAYGSSQELDGDDSDPPRGIAMQGSTGSLALHRLASARSLPGKHADDPSLGRLARGDGTDVGVGGMTQTDLLKNILASENQRKRTRKLILRTIVIEPSAPCTL